MQSNTIFSQLVEIIVGTSMGQNTVTELDFILLSIIFMPHLIRLILHIQSAYTPSLFDVNGKPNLTISIKHICHTLPNLG